MTTRQPQTRVTTDPEQRFRIVFESHPLPMWAFDLETLRFLEVNEAAVRTYGYTREEFLGMSILQIRPEEERANVERAIRQAEATPYHAAWEWGRYRHCWKDGTIRDVEISWSRLPWEGRKAALILVRDITEQLRQEEEIRRYADIVQAADLGIAVWRLEDPGDAGNFRLLQANPAVWRLLGVEGPARMGKTLREIFPGLIAAGIAPKFLQAVTENRSIDLGEFPYAGDGIGPLWFTTRLHPLPDRHLAVIFDVVTSRKEAETAIQRSQERFELVARATNDVVYDWNLGDDHVWWSDNIVSVLGWPRGEVGPALDWWEDKLHPEDRERVLEGMEAQIRSGATLWSDEYRFRHSDGTYGHYFDRGHILRGADGAPVRMIGAMMDITERKTAERERERLFRKIRRGRLQLRALSRRLVEAQERESRRLARELHDEIGQALTGLKFLLEGSGSAGTAPGEPDPARALGIVNDLMSRVRSMSMDLRPAMLDDLGIVPALLWHFERFTKQTRVRVEFRHSGIERRFPHEAETAVFRIVQEALTNAARHSGADRVDVEIRGEPGRLYIRVEDPGRGFDPEASYPRRSAGITGMAERARLLGGRFRVRSGPGGGTILTAEFPATPAGEAGRPEKP